MKKLCCDHCGDPITDAYPENYYVRVTDDEDWAVHVDCYPEWQVGLLEDEFKKETKYGDVEDETWECLSGESWRLERAVKAHQKLLSIIAQCEALTKMKRLANREQFRKEAN